MRSVNHYLSAMLEVVGNVSRVRSSVTITQISVYTGHNTTARTII